MAELRELQTAALEAKSLTEDPAFRRAYETLYRGALDEIRFSLPGDKEGREAAYWRLRTLEALDEELQTEIKAPLREEKRQDRKERQQG